MAEKQVRRKRYTTDNILKHVKLKPPYDEIYNEKAINIIGEEVLNTLADLIKEGYAVDFGLGRCYLKLRRNNAILNDKAKSMSLVFRGEVKDKIQEEIDITEVAPDDFERDIPAEELNELAEAINKMKREAGETDFVEMTTESEHSIYYGDHAVREIIKYLRKGEVPQKRDADVVLKDTRRSVLKEVSLDNR